MTTSSATRCPQHASLHRKRTGKSRSCCTCDPPQRSTMSGALCQARQLRWNWYCLPPAAFSTYAMPRVGLRAKSYPPQDCRALRVGGLQRRVIVGCPPDRRDAGVGDRRRRPPRLGRERDGGVCGRARRQVDVYFVIHETRGIGLHLQGGHRSHVRDRHPARGVGPQTDRVAGGEHGDEHCVRDWWPAGLVTRTLTVPTRTASRDGLCGPRPGFDARDALHLARLWPGCGISCPVPGPGWLVGHHLHRSQGLAQALAFTASFWTSFSAWLPCAIACPPSVGGLARILLEQRQPARIVLGRARGRSLVKST